VVATDGTVTSQASTTLRVGDFGIGITPSTQTAPQTGTASYNLIVNSINGFMGQVDISVSGLPSGASVVSGTGITIPNPSPLTFNIATNDVAAGSYLFTVTGTSGSLTHRATATLQVQGAAPPPDFTGSVSPTSATLAVGQSANFAITLNSQNGATGTVNLQCLNVPSGTTWTFKPAAPTLPANGSASDTLTVQVNSRPSASPPGSPAPWSFPTAWFGTFWFFVITLAAGSALTMKMWRRRPRLPASVAILIGFALLFFTLTSCGGGGGGTSAPPPPSPVSFTITVQANGAGVAATQTIGTLTITVN
jgi:hypothetical protein